MGDLSYFDFGVTHNFTLGKAGNISIFCRDSLAVTLLLKKLNLGEDRSTQFGRGGKDNRARTRWDELDTFDFISKGATIDDELEQWASPHWNFETVPKFEGPWSVESGASWGFRGVLVSAEWNHYGSIRLHLLERLLELSKLLRPMPAFPQFTPGGLPSCQSWMIFAPAFVSL